MIVGSVTLPLAVCGCAANAYHLKLAYAFVQLMTLGPEELPPTVCAASASPLKLAHLM